MKLSFLLGDMTWLEFRDVLSSVKGVIIPVGSTEQHGPHLPLNNDSISTEYYALEIAKRLAPMVLVTPTIPLGVSEHHMRLPGTLTIKPETLKSIVWDMASSLKHHGVRKIILFNGHGGNIEALEEIVEQIQKELDMKAFLVNVWTLYPEMETEVLESKVWGHACEFETSEALHMYPEKVRNEKIKAWDRSMGVTGHPELATKKKGQKLVQVILKKMITIVKGFLEGS